MDKRGQGYAIDLLVFALMVALACSILIKASPEEPTTLNDRYTTNLATSVLQTFQNVTAGEVGGFKYKPEAINFVVPWSSGEKNLGYKTLAQLLVEDILCNLRFEVGGQDVLPLKTNLELDRQVRKLLKATLDEIIGGRFDYRLVALTDIEDFSPLVRIHFETSVVSFSDNEGLQVCSETIRMCLPITQEELLTSIQNTCPITNLGLESEPLVEITLSLWSK
jgi:hypothetical protein